MLVAVGPNAQHAPDSCKNPFIIRYMLFCAGASTSLSIYAAIFVLLPPPNARVLKTSRDVYSVAGPSTPSAAAATSASTSHRQECEQRRKKRQIIWLLIWVPVFFLVRCCRSKWQRVECRFLIGAVVCRRRARLAERFMRQHVHKYIYIYR